MRIYNGDSTPIFKILDSTNLFFVLSEKEKTEIDGLIDDYAETLNLEVATATRAGIVKLPGDTIDITTEPSCEDIVVATPKLVHKALNKAKEYSDLETKIQAVKVNNTTATITNKTVNIEVPTATSLLTNDSGFLVSENISGKVDKTTKINGLSLSGDITLSKTSIGLENVDNTSDLNKPISTATLNALDNKVTKDGDKVLSDNNYTTVEKEKLAGIAASSEVNTIVGVKVNNIDATIDSDRKVNITVPTGTSLLTNDSNFITSDIVAELASSTNKLADKNFVNSSISTNTANYISNDGEPFTSIEALQAITATNNDYAFVTGTENENTYYDRYKYSNSSWSKEYRLNNSSFTAAQWAAINSNVTEEGFNNKANTSDVNEALSSKVDKIEGKGLSTNDFSNSDKIVTNTFTIVDSSYYLTETWTLELILSFIRNYSFKDCLLINYAPIPRGAISSNDAVIKVLLFRIEDSYLDREQVYKWSGYIASSSSYSLRRIDLTTANNRMLSSYSKSIYTTEMQPKESGKGLSDKNYTADEKTKLAGILTGANINIIEGIKLNDTEVTPDDDKIVNITLTKADIGLSNVDNTSDLNKPISTATQTALDGKVDKIEGKGLSTNDLTNLLKNAISTSTVVLTDYSPGDIIHYTGETTANYTHGYFYECVVIGLSFTYSLVTYYIKSIPTESLSSTAYADSEFTTPVGEFTVFGPRFQLLMYGDIESTLFALGQPIMTPIKGLLQLNVLSNSYNDLTDKPNLATVASSGSYNDLINKPDIAALLNSINTLQLLYNNLLNIVEGIVNPSTTTTGTSISSGYYELQAAWGWNMNLTNIDPGIYVVNESDIPLLEIQSLVVNNAGIIVTGVNEGNGELVDFTHHCLWVSNDILSPTEDTISLFNDLFTVYSPSIPIGTTTTTTVLPDETTTTTLAVEMYTDSAGIKYAASSSGACVVNSNAVPDNLSPQVESDYIGEITIPTGIPDNYLVRKVCPYAFYQSAIISVIISEYIDKIGDKAFYGCLNLELIRVDPTTPPELGDLVFDNTGDCPIYVPIGFDNLYKLEWPEYSSRIYEVIQ